MGIIIDILIVLIIAGTVIVAVKNGFVKTALGTLGFFIAATVALSFCGTVGERLAESKLADKIGAAVDTAVESVVDSENYTGIFDADEDESALSVLLSTLGADGVYDGLSENYNSYLEQGYEAARDYIKEGVKEKAVPFCCNVIAFLLLFFGTRLLVKIAELLISRLTRLPVLKQADKALGAVMGVLLSLLRVCLFCLALRIIIPVGSAVGIGFLEQVNPADSFLYCLFKGGNILSVLI